MSGRIAWPKTRRLVVGRRSYRVLTAPLRRAPSTQPEPEAHDGR